MFNNMNVLLVDTENMGKEYAKVLRSLNCEAMIVGRSEKDIMNLEETLIWKFVPEKFRDTHLTMKYPHTMP